ncbi:MerR family transcriptional regulator [Lacrimispora indolis]|uniref:MerR family transcriptional regulator n=1 Tax=Lacrimispora indolis TaxID=69825 RepID=UPI000425C50F|nr:MerR family transcriptional regulator [[Clostridium] methoxybenzovorans]
MYSMKEVCKQTGMTYETLKFYCNEGLIPNVKRDKNNYRIFDDKDIAWIKSLSCLKQCGMGITEMKQYVELCIKGKSSIPERKIILDQKRKALLEKLQEINECIEYIDTKQQFYDDVLNNKIKYVSNLINADENP